MEYSSRSLQRFFAGYLPVTLKPGFGLNLFILVLGLGMGAITAYLIVSDRWIVALGLVLLLPGVILLHNYPLLGLVAWLVVTPFLVDFGSSSFRRVYWIIHRALPVVILVFIVMSATLGTSKRKLPKLGWIELAMIGYVILSLFSIFLQNQDPVPTAYQYYDRVFIPILLYMIIRLLPSDQTYLKRLLPVILFICLTQTTFGFMYVFARGMLPVAWLRIGGERATGSLGAQAVYSTTLLFSAMLLLHAALNRKTKDVVWMLYIATFILAIPAVFFSFSRASWLAAVIVLLGLTYLYPKFMVRLGLVFSPFVLLIIAGGSLADQFRYANERLNSDQSALGRLPVYMAAFRMFQTKPVFGWGYDNFELYDRQFQERVADLVSPEKDLSSHSVYLTILAEQGGLGLGLFLAPVIGLLVLSIKKWPSLPTHGFWSKKLLLILWLAIIAHVVVNNFSDMRIVFGLGIWWIILGNIAYMVHSTPGPVSDRSNVGSLWRAT